MKAGIIAAGWGERLGQKVPKALTRVGGKCLIDYTLDGLQAAGVTEVTCIVNEAATSVPGYVKQSGRNIRMDWIVRTTPSSMHSFLIVLERLAQTAPPQRHFFMATVDSVCPPSAYKEFAEACALFKDADVCLGLTSLIDDEKPLRVAMHGTEGTGLMPKSIAEDPEAFEVMALTDNGFQSDYVTSGFYRASARVLTEKDKALASGYTALRQLLGHLLKYGYRTFGVPLPPVIDVDRPQDIQAAEAFLKACIS